MYSTFGFMVLNIGGPIGVYCFGLLNDTIGRKVTYFFCLTTFVLGNVLTTLAPNFLFWAGSRFIVGLTVPALYQIPFIICNFTRYQQIPFVLIFLSCFRFGNSRTELQSIHHNDDQSVLRCRYDDAGRDHLFHSRLGATHICHFGSVRDLLHLLVFPTRKSQVVVGQ